MFPTPSPNHSSSLLYNSQQKILSLLICSPKALSQQWQLMNYLGHELQIAAGESGISSITSVALKLCSQKLGFQCVLWFSFLSLSPKFPILWLGGRDPPVLDWVTYIQQTWRAKVSIPVTSD